MKKFLIVFIAVALFTALAGMYAHSETATPAPKFKFGDQVIIALPFYSNCGLGTVTELDPNSTMGGIDVRTSIPAKTHYYTVESIDCPLYDRDTHKTYYRRLTLIISEEDLRSKWHTMEDK